MEKETKIEKQPKTAELDVYDLKLLHRLVFRLRAVAENSSGTLGFHIKTVQTNIEALMDYILSEMFHDYKKDIIDGLSETETTEIEPSHSDNEGKSEVENTIEDK